MARILKAAHSLLQKQVSLDRERSVLEILLPYELGAAGLLFLAGVGLVFWKNHYGLLVAAGILLLVVFGHWLKSRENAQEADQLEAGRSGEQKVADLLAERLSEDFSIINDFEVAVGRKKAQIDHLVIGPTGLFVIETKNWRGTLTGKAGDRFWTLHQPGAQNRKLQVKNPIWQSRRQQNVLRDYLRTQGVDHPPVYSLVAFSNEKTDLLVEETHNQVHAPSSLPSYIIRFSENRVLTPEQIAQVEGLLGATANG